MYIFKFYLKSTTKNHGIFQLEKPITKRYFLLPIQLDQRDILDESIWSHLFWLIKMTSCQFDHWSIMPSLFALWFRSHVIIMLHLKKWCGITCCKKVSRYIFYTLLSTIFHVLMGKCYSNLEVCPSFKLFSKGLKNIIM
jgi:hypothetical protein